ncbi:AraC family transcriptional regulator [Marivibrio halodurans]|nr:helix-turn-helix transcriptional regulator [Marivibrio halodurans]
MVRAEELEPGYRYPPHNHPWGQLVYALDGSLTVETEAGSWLAPPQRAVWVPPNVDHAVSATGPASFRSLYCDMEASATLPDRVTVLEIAPLLRELIRAFAAFPERYDREGAEGRLVAVVLDRLRSAAATPAPLHLPLPSDRRLHSVTAALIADPADGRGLEVLATGAGASVRTLARLFQREMGMSFGQWRTRRRLIAAIERLADGVSVTTVAYDLGYESPSAFVAMFRRETGRTPGQFLDRPAAVSRASGVRADGRHP